MGADTSMKRRVLSLTLGLEFQEQSSNIKQTNFKSVLVLFLTSQQTVYALTVCSRTDSSTIVHPGIRDLAHW